MEPSTRGAEKSGLPTPAFLSSLPIKTTSGPITHRAITTSSGSNSFLKTLLSPATVWRLLFWQQELTRQTSVRANVARGSGTSLHLVSGPWAPPGRTPRHGRLLTDGWKDGAAPLLGASAGREQARTRGHARREPGSYLRCLPAAPLTPWASGHLPIAPFSPFGKLFRLGVGPLGLGSCCPSRLPGDPLGSPPWTRSHLSYRKHGDPMTFPPGHGN